MSSPTPSATSTVEAGNSVTTLVTPTSSHTSGKTASRAASSSPVVVGAKTKLTPSAPITASSPTPSATANSPPSPLLIGKSFIKQYYQVLSTSPQHIKRFYQPNTSVLSHSFLSSVPAESKTLSSTNQSEIFEWAVSPNASSAGDTEEAGGRLCFDFGRGAIDAQETIQGGILLVVTGHMKLPDAEKAKAFVHTFFLNNGAPAGKKRQFYVHNDILRFVAESGVEEAVEEESNLTPPNQQQPNDSTTLTTEKPVILTDAVVEEPTVAVQDTIPDKTEQIQKPAAQAQDITPPAAEISTVTDEKPPSRKGGNVKSNPHGNTAAADQPPVKNSANKTESKRKNSSASVTKADQAPNTNTNKTTADGGGGGAGRKKNHERSNSKDLSPTPKEERKSKKNKGKGGRSRKDRGRSPSSDQTDSNASNTANATGTSSKQKDSKHHNASSSNNKPKVPGSWAGVVAGAGGPGTTAPATTNTNAYSTPSSPSRPSPAAAAAAATAAAHLASSNSAAVEESKEGMDMDGIEKPSTASKADNGQEVSPSNNGANSRGGHPPRANSSSNQQSLGNNVTQRTADATIFLKNIPDKTKEADIRSIFEPYATTANQKILGITLHASRGFCFVDFDAKLVVDAILKDVEASKEANEAGDSNGKDSKFFIYGKFLDVGRKVQVDKGRGGGGSSQHRYRNRSASPGNGTYHKPRGSGHHHRRNSPRGGTRPTGGSQQQQQQQTQKSTTK